MFPIVYKKELAPHIKRIDIAASRIAKKSRPGQFVIVRIDEKGERIPLTVAGRDLNKGTIALIFQEVGKTTLQLGKLSQGDSLSDVVGPLGKPTEIKKVGTVVAVGGGVGVAEVYPVAEALKAEGNSVIGIIGAKTKELLILEREMETVCDELYITTDDGSYRQKGFVSDVLKELIEKGEAINVVYAIGPLPMMKAVCEVTRLKQLRTVVSLNPVMVDGTGMCGSCRVSAGGETKFACVDGPEFDGHLVDWDELKAREALFCDAEKQAIELLEKGQKCARKCPSRTQS